MFAKFRHAEPAQSTVSQVARAEEVQLDVAPRDDDATSSSATVSATVEDAELQPGGVTPDTLPPHGGDQSVTSAAEEVDADVTDDDSSVSEAGRKQTPCSFWNRGGGSRAADGHAGKRNG